MSRPVGLTNRWRPDFRTMYDNVLVPTDGSEHANCAARHANQIAGRFDATGHVLSVVDLATSAGPFDAGGVDEQYRDRLAEQSQEAIADVESEMDPDRTVVTESRNGDPAEVVLEYAERNDVDLIAMGTTGQTGLSRFLLGSTTERVVRHSTVPVLAINAREE